MNDFTVAVLLSLISAICYAAAAVVQQRLAASLPTSAASLVAVRHRQWWVSVALNGGGSLLHVVALRYGPLTVVQPLGTLTLVLALPLGAALNRRKVTGGERRGAAATVVGLGGLLILTASAAPVMALTTGEVLLVGCVAAATLVGLVTAASRTSLPGPRALLYAASSGIASGVASGLTQTIVVRVTHQGWGAVADPAVALVLGLATAGLLLSQAAYRGYGLGAPLAMSTLANPVAAAAIGLTLLGEGHVAGPAGAGFAVTAAVVAGYGVALLTRAVAVPELHPNPIPGAASDDSSLTGSAAPTTNRGTVTMVRQRRRLTSGAAAAAGRTRQSDRWRRACARRARPQTDVKPSATAGLNDAVFNDAALNDAASNNAGSNVDLASGQRSAVDV